MKNWQALLIFLLVWVYSGAEASEPYDIIVQLEECGDDEPVVEIATPGAI